MTIEEGPGVAARISHLARQLDVPVERIEVATRCPCGGTSSLVHGAPFATAATIFRLLHRKGCMRPTGRGGTEFALGGAVVVHHIPGGNA